MLIAVNKLYKWKMLAVNNAGGKPFVFQCVGATKVVDSIACLQDKSTTAQIPSAGEKIYYCVRIL